ncbi:MAG: hypothetical protein H8D95_00200 [Candidatus Endolissoclinum sp.]|nr:hypothetical protein [Candidatus Endolissoclinum sp.]
MATNVKILLRRGLRSELSGDTLLGGELGYTTDTNQLYVGVVAAVNEIRFDPFANAHAVIQSWLDSADCPVSGLTVDEDLNVADIPAGQIDNIISALNTYAQTIVFNSDVATFTVGELLTQYVQKRTILTSPNAIPDTNSITATFDVEGETITASAVTLSALLTTLQANAALKTANVISQVVNSGASSKLKICKIDGQELNINFASGHAALGFTQATNTVAAVSTSSTSSTVVATTETNLSNTTIAFADDTGNVQTATSAYTTLTSTEIDNLGFKGEISLTYFGAAAPTSNFVWRDVSDSAEQNDMITVYAPPSDEYTFTLDHETLWQIDSTDNDVYFKQYAYGEFSITSATVLTTSNTQFKDSNGFYIDSAHVTITNTSGTNYKVVFWTHDVTVGDIIEVITGGATDYDVFANGKITASVPNKIITAGNFVVGRAYTIVTSGTTDYTLIGSTDSNIGTVFTATGVGTGDGTAKEDGTTSVTVELSEAASITSSGFRQEGTGYPYANAPDNSAYFKFGTPSTPDYSALTPGVDSTSITGTSDTRIGLFGSKRSNVEVLTEESRNQLFTNQHLKSYSASTGLRSDLYKKQLTGTSGTFLSYVAAEATSFFIDYSLKQVGSSITFVRTGTLRMINGVPQTINLAKLTDTNVEVHQDTNTDTIVDANEMSNIVFVAAIDGSNIKVNYTQDANFTTEISYTVKRWTM